MCSTTRMQRMVKGRGGGEVVKGHEAHARQVKGKFRFAAMRNKAPLTSPRVDRGRTSAKRDATVTESPSPLLLPNTWECLRIAH